ncbi:M56 family metallopeptidase [Massilia sp. ST3]|uniref:M56 family metallopeptidase n=1 Tax=Massilia sp. ST3 TaxID=2824903 RepID=UPI001B84444D|nr:M56 family metallopeptidase [Massilia sp. ST3]MBQ5949826.1 peptidase M56 [Massilia sp. ST3]
MSETLALVASSLAWALLDFVWQGVLVAWVAALALALLRRARPQVRYAVACAALLLCAALPLGGTVQRILDADTTTTMLPLATLAAVDASVPQMSVVTLDPDKLAGWESALQARLPLVVLFWACGAGLLALRMAAGLLWVRRRSKPGHYRSDPYWQARLDELARRFGIARRVTLGLVDDLDSPVTAGWWRPLVLVPASLATGMPPQLLEALLAHELAHVRRFDYLVNLIQSAIEILLFYHPAVWWLSQRIRSEREQIADDLAASELGEPRRLALALSELDLFQFTPQLAPGAHGGDLMSRIKRLVRPEAEPLNWKLALPILGLATCAALYSWAAPAHAAAQAAPQAEAPARSEHREHRVVREAARDEPYAVVRANDGGFNISGSSDDWDDVKAARSAIDGEFVWFRENGRSYYIQDRELMAKVNAAWAPVDRLGKQMDVYGKEMDKHGKKMEVLGRQMEQASSGIQPVANKRELREIEEGMRALGEQMETLGRELAAARDDDERERIGRRMEEAGKRMEAAGKRMEQAHNSPQMRKAHAEMEALGKQMKEAGKPMDALGKRMGALGKDMERESKAADQTVRGLIRDAKAKGLAKPVPGEGTPVAAR